MAGSVNPTLFLDLGLPAGESYNLLSADSAGKIQNFVASNQGGLVSIMGPCPVEPDRGAGYPTLGEAHGVFNTEFSGVYSMTLWRMGSVLYEHQGWSRAFTALKTGLTDELRPGWPDQFVRVMDQIIWCNGIDRPLVVLMTGQVLPLGFTRGPAAPTVDGPDSPTEAEKQYYYPNSQGLSWPGHIGTAGEVLHDNDGKLLPGTWTYGGQMQDQLGNRSPLSARSAQLELDEIVVKPYRFTINFSSAYINDGTASGVDISDLYRGFSAITTESGQEHHTRTLLYRTENERYKGDQLYLTTSFESARSALYFDQKADGALSEPYEPVEPMPLFRVMCGHGGRLIVGNTPTDPTIIMMSQEGYPGTLLVKYTRRLPGNQGELTCLHSHGGQVYAFSAYSMNMLTAEGVEVVDAGVGACGPNVIQSLDDGSMVWLGQDNFYRMRGSKPEIISDAISALLYNGINKSRMKLATSWVDPSSGTYYCALSRAGSIRNDLVLGWHPKNGWSELTYATIKIASACVTQGSRPHVYAAATVGTDGFAFVVNRVSPAYTVPSRAAIYRTRWLRADPLARVNWTIRNIHISFLETGDYEVTVNVYRNQVESPVVTQTLRLYDLPISTSLSPTTVELSTVGTDKIRNPRLATRWCSFNGPGFEGLTDIKSAMIEIVASSPAKLHLYSLSVDYVKNVTAGEMVGRMPKFDATS